MIKTKWKRSLIVIIPLILFTTIILADPDPDIGTVAFSNPDLDQTSLSINVNTTSITIFRNESTTLRVNVTVEGNLQSGAWFLAEGFNYDLGERFLDLQNGSYDLFFVPDGFKRIPSGNYTLILKAFFGDENISTNIDFNLLSTDFSPPQLNVYQPDGNDSYSSYMFLNLTGSDDVGWTELQVIFREQLIFLLLQEEEFKGRGQWNTTHLVIETFIFFNPLQGSDEIKIILFDTSYNNAEVITNSQGDANPPAIEIVKPFEGGIITSRNLEIEWIASDDNELSNFVISVNDFELTTLNANFRSSSIQLPIPKGKIVELRIKIVATDVAGNSNIASVSVTYNPNIYAEKMENPFIPSNPVEIVLFFIFGLIVISISGLSILLIQKYTRKSKKSKKLYGIEKLPVKDVEMLLNEIGADETIISKIRRIIQAFNEDIVSINDIDILQNRSNTLENEINIIMANSSYYVDFSGLFSLTLSSWLEFQKTKSE